jgi:hypothetical protein
MTKRTILGAAVALLMSSAALAQTNPLAPGEGPPAVDQIAPSAEAPLMPTQPTSEGVGRGGMDHESTTGAGDMMGDDDEIGIGGHSDGHGRRARGHGYHGSHHGRHWRNHHGSSGGEVKGGAVLNFSQGNGGRSFRIRCADGDTTRECTSAILPILERLMPQPTPAGR